jgi:hypothetical protein
MSEAKLLSANWGCHERLALATARWRMRVWGPGLGHPELVRRPGALAGVCSREILLAQDGSH